MTAPDSHCSAAIPALKDVSMIAAALRFRLMMKTVFEPKTIVTSGVFTDSLLTHGSLGHA